MVEAEQTVDCYHRDSEAHKVVASSTVKMVCRDL